MARKELFNYRKLVIGTVLPIVLIILLVQALSAQQSLAVADIEVTKSVDRDLARPGDTVEYSINMENVGDDSVIAAVMTDTVPSDLTVITASVAGGYDDSWGIAGNIITWTGSISGSEGVDISFETVVSETAVFDEPITNTVYVTGTGSLLSDEAVFTVTENITYTMYLPILKKPAPVPTLLSVSFPESSNDYDSFQMTITWSDEGIGRYELQEAHTSDFANPMTYDAGNAKSKTVSHIVSPDYEFYYRVRYIRENGAYSDWSNVIMQYGAYVDHFNNENTGWKIRREDLDDSENYAYYDNDLYKLKITGRWDFAISSPMKVVPWDSYRIQSRMRFDDGVDNLHSYGLIWGGDWNGGECPNTGLTNCLNHYYRLNVLWYGANDQLRTQLKRIDYHDKDGVGRGESLAGYADNGVISPSGGWQTWTIDQTIDGTIRLYINGNLKRTVTGDTTYAGAGTYFGVLATSNEYSGAEPWVDWFKVIPLP